MREQIRVSLSRPTRDPERGRLQEALALWEGTLAAGVWAHLFLSPACHKVFVIVNQK